MNTFDIPVGDWAATGVQWIVTNLSGLFGFLRRLFIDMYDAVHTVLSGPWLLTTILIAVLALVVRGPVMAIGSAAGLTLIVGMNQWENAMASLALVIVAAVIAIAISVPLGIAAAKHRTTSAVIRPVLDLMQTLPAFVYLIPALLLFRIGVAPGIVATIVFAMAPGVRFTELGIRQVDKEVVEAGHAFGAHPRRILRQIQLPLALPTIMAGINQIIMLSLSMVVIAALVGAGGLGQDIVGGLNRLDTALGVEAGLAVVIIAIILDRLTSSLGRGTGLFAKVSARIKAKKKQPEGIS